MKNIWEKVKELFGSRRFWMLTLTAVLQLLKLQNPNMADVLTVIQTWLVGITAVGTVDYFGRKVGGIK